MNESLEIPDGFKMTDLGPLPEEWEVARLGNIIAYQKGRKPATLTKNASRDALPYLTAEYFRTGNAKQFVPPEELAKNIVCDKSDLVLIWDGSNAGDIFTGLKGVLASTMVKLIPNSERLISDLAYFFLKTQFDMLNSQTTGSTIPHVSKSVFENLPVPLPSIPEQRAIAHVLSTLQRAVEAQDKILAAGRELKKSLMRHLFTYGPVPPEQAERVPLKETEIGLVPEEWEVVTVGDVVDSTQYGISLRGSPRGKFPILRMNNRFVIKICG